MKRRKKAGGEEEEIVGNYGPTDRQTHFQSECYSGRQIDRNAVSQSDRQTDIQGRTCTDTGRKSVSQLVRQVGRSTKRETDRQKRPVQSVSQSIYQSVNQSISQTNRKTERQSVSKIYQQKDSETRRQGKSDKELK